MAYIYYFTSQRTESQFWSVFLLRLLWKSISIRIKFQYFQTVLILIWHSFLPSAISAKASTCVKETCQTEQTGGVTEFKKMETIRMCYKEKLTFLSLHSLKVISDLQLLPEARGKTLPVLFVHLQNHICLFCFQYTVKFSIYLQAPSLWSGSLEAFGILL